MIKDWFPPTQELTQNALQYTITPADSNIPIFFSVQSAIKTLKH
jgi:hypothetical protein